MVALTQPLSVCVCGGGGVWGWGRSGGAGDQRYVTPASYTMQPGSFSNPPPPSWGAPQSEGDGDFTHGRILAKK